MIVNSGGIAALIELIGTTKSARVPGIMALGYIAGHSDQLALAIIDSQVRSCHQFLLSITTIRFNRNIFLHSQTHCIILNLIIKFFSPFSLHTSIYLLFIF